MKSRTLGVVAALALTAPTLAQAADFNYSFVDAAFIPHSEVEVNNRDVDGDGVQLRGSLAVTDMFFVFVELQDTDLDARGWRVDSTRWLLGGGGHWPINNNMDFVARAGLVRLDVELNRFDDDDTGFFLGGRLRMNVAPKVEVEAGVEYIGAEAFDSGDDLYVIGEGRYHFTSQLSAGAFVNLSGDVQQLGIYGRLSF